MEDLKNNQIVGEKDTATPKTDSPSIQKTDTKQVAQQKTQKAINNGMLDGMPGKNDTQLVKSAFSGDVKGYKDATNKPSEALSAYNSKAAGLMGFDEKNPPVKMDINEFKKEFNKNPDNFEKLSSIYRNNNNVDWDLFDRLVVSDPGDAYEYLKSKGYSDNEADSYVWSDNEDEYNERLKKLKSGEIQKQRQNDLDALEEEQSRLYENDLVSQGNKASEEWERKYLNGEIDINGNPIV